MQQVPPRFVLCGRDSGLYRMAYREWGDPANPNVLICVHGLTRNGRDFDTLAQAMADRYRVICPDVLGRGASDWLADGSGYQLPLYVQDMLVLLARLDVETVHWIGTSMGGLIGMLLAAMPNTPIRRLVLNDVGPLLQAEALARIGEYVGNAPILPDLAAAERYIRLVSAPFGQLTDPQWRLLTEIMIKPVEGGYTLNYDPKLAEPFKAGFSGDVSLWPFYERIACPTLLTRGAQSDLLSPQTAQEMTERGPKARLVEFPNVGHAPMFLDPAQIAPVREFLLA